MSDERQASTYSKDLVRAVIDFSDELLEYITALEADRARLAFLFGVAENSTRDVVLRDDCEDGCFIRVNGSTYYGDDRTYFRAAIDAAMSSSPLAPTQEGA